MHQFGLALIAFIGFGFSLLMVVSGVAALRDIGVARRSPTKRAPDGTTARRNAQLCLTAFLLSMSAAVGTTLILMALN